VPGKRALSRQRLRFCSLLLQSPSQNEIALSGRWVEPSNEIFPESDVVRTFRRPVGVSGTPVHLDRPEKLRSEDTPRTTPGPSHNRPHTLRHQARTDDAFPLSVRGAYAMAGARPHRAEPGAPARPTKGGAVRIRIALTTAIAVITGLTTGFFTLSTRPPSSAGGPLHQSAHVSVLSNA